MYQRWFNVLKWAQMISGGVLLVALITWGLSIPLYYKQQEYVGQYLTAMEGIEKWNERGCPTTTQYLDEEELHGCEHLERLELEISRREGLKGQNRLEWVLSFGDSIGIVIWFTIAWMILLLVLMGFSALLHYIFIGPKLKQTKGTSESS